MSEPAPATTIPSIRTDVFDVRTYGSGGRQVLARSQLQEGVFGQCEREGFVARSSGALRHANPYGGPPASGTAQPSSVRVEQKMAPAWFAGWDRADAQLHSGSRFPS